MMKSLATLWAVIVVVGMLATGCNKSTTGPDESAPAGVTDEQTARASLATSDAFVENDVQTMDDEEIQRTDYGTFGSINADVTPLWWGRFVQNVNVTVTRDSVQPGDTIAVVHIHKVITGQLRVVAVNGSGDTVRFQKPFTDNTDRNVIFKRVGRDVRRYWLNWVPVATSLVAGGTIPPDNNISVTELQLVSAGGTITVTDPLQFYLRYRWLRLYNRGNDDVPDLQAGTVDTIRATVVSNSTDTDVVALRFGVGTFFKRRMRMHIVSEQNNGDGTFTRVFETPFVVHFHKGFFHAAVDAATKATLYDDTAPYSVSWWGIPYRVF